MHPKRALLSVLQLLWIALSISAASADTAIRYSLPPRRGDIFIHDKFLNIPISIASSNPAEAFAAPASYFAVDFSPILNTRKQEVITRYTEKTLGWIARRIDELNVARAEKKLPLLDKETLEPNVIVGYFNTRRWLPLRVSSMLFPDEVATLLKLQWPPVGPTLVHRPVRSYPENSLASHLVGRFSTSNVFDWIREGKILETDFLFPRQKAGSINGKEYGTGLERTFSNILDSGTPTVMEKVFDAEGNFKSEQPVKNGIDGDSILLTLDYHLQKVAEAIVQDKYTPCFNGKCTEIKSNAKGQPKGFVLIDLSDMSVAAMASSPPIDLKRLSPGYGVNDTYLSDANEDKAKSEPFNSRAFENSYPPASTFKLITALAGLETGTIDENTPYPCTFTKSYLVEINGKRERYHTFKNHVNEMTELKMDEAPMYTYAEALKRSCNTWFYAMANDMFSANPANINKIFEIAKALGYGQAPELPIPGLGKGFMHDRVEDGIIEIVKGKKTVRPFYPGDIADLAIGQGQVEATALQVAWATAQIAQPDNRKKLQLIEAVYKGPERRYIPYQEFVGDKGQDSKPALSDIVKLKNIRLIQKAMIDVANAEHGTALSVNSHLNYAPEVAAKTGTGQWNKKYVAWLTGFFPSSAPRYAFAVFVEGRPNLPLSGGGSVAPLMNAFLSDDSVKAKLAEHLRGLQTDPAPPRAQFVRPPQGRRNE